MYFIIASQVILVLVLKYECTNANQINLTRLIEDRLGIRYHVMSQSHHEYPSIMLRDISYLPVSDYADNKSNEHSQEEQQKQQQQYHQQKEQKQDQFYNDDNENRKQLLRIDRNLLPDYRNLCEIHTKKVQLTDFEFEYQPPYYHEIYCKSYSLVDQSVRNIQKPVRQMCAHPGFHCIQRSKILFMSRRQWTSNCWEPFTKEIASGCDCMWPVSTLGDITAHY